MASMRELKNRRNSIAKTQQIMKAMQVISRVRLKRAKESALQIRPYFEAMYRMTHSILHAAQMNIPEREPDTCKAGVVVVTSNRGLAGGYHANVIRLVAGCGIEKEKMLVYAVGQKGANTLRAGGYVIHEEMKDVTDHPTYEDAVHLSKRLSEDYEGGQIGEIYLVYTEFVSMTVHDPQIRKILPVLGDDKEAEKENFAPMNFDSGREETLLTLIPKYLTAMFYGAFVQSFAAEHASRVQAMESATKNAQDLTDELEIRYHRARQGMITQELTEIIAGTEATE